MKRLILLRHAKSNWKDPGLEDFDRPLNKRGQQAAPVMGQYLLSENLLPDHVICSSALRTRQTMALVSDCFSHDYAMDVTYDLYHASPGEILGRIRSVVETAKTLMLVGHNPGMEDLALALDDRGNGPQRDRIQEKFPTAALAVLDFKADSWSDITFGEGRLERFVRPADLA